MAKGIVRWSLGLLCVIVVAGGLHGFASEQPTIGDFVQKLAQLNRLDASTPADAEQSLRSAGYRLPANIDLSLTLTEGRVASISRAMGLVVTTQRPGASFSERQVDQLLAYFGPQMSGNGDSNQTADDGSGDQGGPPFNPWTKGKGKGKGKGHNTPSEPV